MQLSLQSLSKFTETEKESLDNIVQQLSNIIVLARPQSTATDYQVVTDKRQYTLRAALHQVIEGKPVPIEFFSKKLSLAQTRYSTNDKELLAAYLAEIPFYYLIKGCHVVLFTDHKPLCRDLHSLTTAKSVSNGTSQYSKNTLLIPHTKKGNENVVDCMSQLALAVHIDACDLPEVMETPSKDKEI